MNRKVYSVPSLYFWLGAEADKLSWTVHADFADAWLHPGLTHEQFMAAAEERRKKGEQ